MAKNKGGEGERKKENRNNSRTIKKEKKKEKKRKKKWIHFDSFELYLPVYNSYYFQKIISKKLIIFYILIILN